MTLRTLLQKFFLLCGVVALILVVGGADSLPYVFLVPLAVLLWGLYIFMEIRAKRKERNRPAVYIKSNGKWVAIDGSGRSFDTPNPPKNSLAIYDQDA